MILFIVLLVGISSMILCGWVSVFMNVVVFVVFIMGLFFFFFFSVVVFLVFRFSLVVEKL